MKKIILLMIVLVLIPICSALTQSSSSYRLQSFYGTGGNTNLNLPSNNLNIDYGISQYAIGEETTATYTTKKGLYYISALKKIGIFVQPAAKQIYLFFIGETGLEYVKLNLT